MEEITCNDSHITTKVNIGGMTVYAKYFQLSHTTVDSDWDWSTWDKITIPFHRVKRVVKDAYWNVRYAFQRMFKGYDSVEVFDTFDGFIKRYTKILTEFKRCSSSFPCGITEKEWENIIDEMIYHLHYMDEDNVDKELCKHVPDGWIPSWETTGEIMNEHKEKFFQLFSKYFYNLWD